MLQLRLGKLASVKKELEMDTSVIVEEPEMDTAIDIPIDENCSEEDIMNILSVGSKPLFDANESETARMLLKQERHKSKVKVGNPSEVLICPIDQLI